VNSPPVTLKAMNLAEKKRRANKANDLCSHLTELFAYLQSTK
jgi:hypothetical protein